MKIMLHSQKAKRSRTVTKSTKAAVLIIALTAALSAVIVLWMSAKYDGDIFVAIAGGKDIIGGKLAAPDQWSFSTGGKVWVNQNWLADVIFYLIYAYAGQWGMLAFKFMLLAGCCILVLIALIKKGIEPVVALPVLAVGLLCFDTYAFLRPNLIAVAVFMPLLFICLFISRKKSFYLWITAALIIIWANTHGSYIIGIFAVFVWVGMYGIKALKRNFAEGFRQWLLIFFLPAITALGASALINPYGFNNLIFSFAAYRDPVWNTNINEWKPVWYDNFSGLSTLLVVFILFFIVTVIIRIISFYYTFRRHDIKNKKMFNSTEMNFEELFEVLVAVILLMMAIYSRRLIPYAIIAIVFPLATYLKSFLNYTGIVFMSIIAVIISISIFSYNFYPYSSKNAFDNKGMLFEKMQYMNSDFPVGAVEFLSTNGIGGNSLCPWKWEGYLRLMCPNIKIYAGARAQQIYDAATYRNYLNLSSYDPDIRLLRQNNIDMIILPCNQGNFGVLIKRALADGWMPIYADSSDLIIIDTANRRNKMLVQSAKNGRLVYSGEAAKLSQYAMILTEQTGKDRKTKLDKLTELSKEYNIPWIYYGLSPILMDNDRSFTEKVETFCKSRLDYFLSIAGNSSDGRKIYFSAGEILSALIDYYEKTGRREEIARLGDYSRIESAIGVQFN